MTTSSDAYVTFTVGRYDADGVRWREASTGPVETISLEEFRAIFDEAGEETIDTTGDIDPVILLRIIGRPRSADDQTAALRLVCHWACSRGARVRFDVERPEPLM